MADGTEYKNVRSSGTYNGISGGIPLPEGTTGVKAVMTSKLYYMTLELRFSGHLLPSENMKNIIKNRNDILLYNYDSSYVKDHNNNIYSSTNTYLNKTSYTPVLIKNSLVEKDQEEFGKEVYHSVYTSYNTYGNVRLYGNVDKYTRITKGETSNNKWVKYVSEPGNRRVRAEYVGVAYERVSYDSSVLSSDEVKNYNIIK